LALKKGRARLDAESYVVSLKDASPDAAPLAEPYASLGALARAGIPVPAGFVITSHALVTFLGQPDLNDHLTAALVSIDLTDRRAAAVAATAIRRLIVDDGACYVLQSQPMMMLQHAH
jgi:hypothetical protein